MPDELLNSISDPFGTPRLGFGMLRIDAESSEHREALRDALLAGVDLFDLGDFAGDPARFAATTKLLLGLVAEYARAPVRVLVRGNLGAAKNYSGRIERDSRIEWIYLVADPEFTLASLDWDVSKLYSRLASELDTLEALCARGVLAAYGVGSAALTYPKESPDALALEPMILGRENLDWDARRSTIVRPENRRHFQWIEFPFNLYESGAFTEESQAIGAQNSTLLAAARAWNLRTIARRPLDAVTDVGLRRLIRYPDHHRLDLHEAVRLTLETALAAESALPPDFGPRWAHRLRDQLKYVTDPEQWKEILRRKVEPDLAVLRGGVAQRGDAGDAGRKKYVDSMEALLLAVKLWCEKSAAERNERLRCRLIEAAPSLGRKRREEDRDLALLALRIYRSIASLDYVLVGMRSPKYVHSFIAAQANFSADEVLPREELRAVLIAAHSEFEKGPS